jgi:hypothetical protein
MHPDHSERKPKSLRLWVDGLGFSMSSEMRKDDMLRKLMFYAEPTRGDSGQAGRRRRHSTVLGAEGYTQNQRAIEEP